MAGVRGLGRAKAGEGGLVANGTGARKEGWWGEKWRVERRVERRVESREESRERGQREGEQQGEQRARVADVRWLFYFFEGNFLVVENIRCFLLLMKGVFISS